MMTRPVSTIKALGLVALLLLACPPSTSNGSGSGGLFASAATTSDTDYTTGGAPDAGTTTMTMTDDYNDPCDGTPAPSAAMAAAGDTPSPVVSYRCIPIATSYGDSLTDSSLSAPAAATPAPSEAAATPEPTLTGGGGGAVVDEPSASPTTMMPSASSATEPPAAEGGAGTGASDAAPTPMPTAASPTDGGDGDRDAAIDDDMTPSPVDAGAIGATSAPTNEDGQAAGDEADGASGLAPPGSPTAVLAAAFGLVVAAAVLAA
ncbi:unnamed protein product [Scytosiphon promiscuus]